MFTRNKKIWRWLKSLCTPKHKHVWVDKDSVYNDEGKYLGTLFICYCGKMEVDTTLTNRVMRSLVLATLEDLPPLSADELCDFKIMMKFKK